MDNTSMYVKDAFFDNDVREASTFDPLCRKATYGSPATAVAVLRQCYGIEWIWLRFLTYQS